MSPQTLYVGTYTTPLGHVDGHGAGIYRLHFDPADGTLRHVGVTEGPRNPSYLAHAPFLERLYAVEECAADDNPHVIAYAIGPDGALTHYGSRPAQGGAPCHALVDPAERWLFVAHYGGGSVAVYPLEEDGRLGPVATVVRHSGRGPDAERQDGPHAHGCALDRSGRYLFVADLGIDRVMVYAFDRETGALDERPPGVTTPGAGPRHLVVHPNNRFVYVVNELNATVACFTHDDGTLTPLQRVSTRSKGATGVVQPAALRITRNGRFLYASNRIDENSIASFVVDPDSGMLTPTGHISTAGRTPRDFMLDETDAYLTVANQDSDTLVVLRLDEIDGTLQPTDLTIDVPSPAGLAFV